MGLANAPRLVSTLLVALVVMTAGRAEAGGLTTWLAVQDPLERCPAIVALNGDQPARVEEAARLYHAGAGQEIWLTNDPRSGNHEVADAGTASNARRLVDSAGIPSGAIRLVPGSASGTRAELTIVAAELRRRGLPCALLVTSPVHARRVKATWAQVAGTGPRGVVRHAAGAGHTGWWVEVLELAGTMLAGLGLPW